MARGRLTLLWAATFTLAAWGGVGLWAGEAAKPEGGPAPQQQTISPERQAAEDLLERYRTERKVLEDQRRFLAQQHVQTADAYFNNQAWEDARRHYAKALELDPTDKEAQEGLSKCQRMLGVAKGRFGDLARDYARQRAIALEVQKTELNNKFAEAKALFDQARYGDAIEAFTTVSARAKYLSPNIDVGEIATQAELYIQKSMRAMEEKRRKDEERRLAEAQNHAEELRQRREALLEERARALVRQATTLFNEGRFEEARKVCDEILRRDPTNGTAESLRESCIETKRKREIEQALKDRRLETDRHWQETRAQSVPYTRVEPSMPPERFEEVRSRKAVVSIGGEEVKEEAWEAKIRDAMNKKITFDFVETPLQDVITFISQLAGVNIVLDPKAVADEPRNVTLRVNDMTLQSALNWVLQLVNLKFTLKDQAIFISKPDLIYGKPVMRMYDVTDLTVDIKDFKGRAASLASDTGYSSAGGAGGYGDTGTEQMAQDFFDVDQQDKEEDKLTGESLVQFIKKTIAPGTWSDDTGVGEF